MRLALHARVLVDRHRPSVLSRAVAEWDAPTLEGRLVRLEPLRPEHEKGLWLASRDPRTWRWLSIVQPQTRTEWTAFLQQALDAAAAGTEIPLVTIRSGKIVGSTRFLALRPEHRSIEIGWTWLHPSTWSSGANVEAKFLQLRHAFDVWGCRRVELKTDALNERSRGALEALGTTFEGVHRKHLLVREGENRDSAWYSVTDDDWPAVRAHLETRLAER
jgi:RimJ/RimL family protein N-acetyltransferase